MPTKDRSGWAYGECVGSDEWLTIMGSAHRRPVLHGTQAEAEAALAGEPYRNNPHLNLVVRHVTEAPHSGVSGGYAYRITAIRRVVITDAMRAQMPGIPPSCGHCGDDLDIHDWIDLTRDGTVVNCDRSNS